jgi:hypothetical protein
MAVDGSRQTCAWSGCLCLPVFVQCYDLELHVVSQLSKTLQNAVHASQIMDHWPAVSCMSARNKAMCALRRSVHYIGTPQKEHNAAADPHLQQLNS